jgi:integrase
VFSTGRRRGAPNGKPAPISGFSQGKRYLDKAVAEIRAQGAGVAGRKPRPIEPWRLHDFRRTGVTKLAGLGFDSIVVDKLLAHQPAKLLGVAAVYQRHDFARERAAALDAWAAHVTSTDADNVVRLRPVG